MNLTIISASAGSGKTTRLTETIVEAIRGGIEPAGVMATTFTKMAAQELSHRVRAALIAEGLGDAADAIQTGLIGTINSTVGQLLEQFCWDAGISPRLDVIEPDDAALLLRSALAEAIAGLEDASWQALHRMGVGNDDEDLAQVVKAIVDQARGNAISAEGLGMMAERSAQALLAYFPECWSASDGAQRDRALQDAIAFVLSEVPGRTFTKTAQSALEKLRAYDRAWRFDGDLAWSRWVSLTKIDFGAANKDLTQLVRDAATGVIYHPRLRDDVARVIGRVFELAASGLQRVQDLKKSRGLIDFVDQEALTYDLLSRPEIADQVRERIQALWVDEFQDSSPIQLALMHTLARLAKVAWWVGDPKQAIYGFRGTDPELMQWAVRELAEDRYDVLNTSYRSRPELVQLVNGLFGQAFGAQGIPRERVRLHAHRETPVGAGPALEVWQLAVHGNARQPERQAIAERVADMLAHPTLYPVADGAGQRPLRGGDIAILCRSNDDCRDVAKALNDQGVAASVGRAGLLDTPEVGYALAGLRVLWDPDDTLALAELVHLRSEGDGAWLREWLADASRFVGQAHLHLPGLAEARSTLGQLTLSEMLDRSLSLTDAWNVVRGWTDAPTRTGNLERIRALAQSFEERAATLSIPATVPQFLTALLDGQDAESGAQARSHSDQAVEVLTYHRAKGLEWPMVVLAFSPEKSVTPFGVQVVAGIRASIENPLAGRWIRYWPWPFGTHQTGVGVDFGLDQAAAEEQDAAERLRLLYVAMTRPRDYLVWAYRENKPPGLLERLLPGTMPTVGATELELGTDRVPMRVIQVQPSSAAAVRSDGVKQTIWVVPDGATDPWQRIASRLAPSHTVEDRPGIVIDTIELGRRIPLTGNPEMERLGMMVHAFLAASGLYPVEAREALARETLGRWGEPALEAEHLIEMARRFRQAMEERYPGFQEHAEWPVRTSQDGQVTLGWIDSLWEGETSFVIVDHKTFPGPEPLWEERAKSHLGQLQRYQAIVEDSSSKPVSALWIHMPVVGRMIRIGTSP